MSQVDRAYVSKSLGAVVGVHTAMGRLGNVMLTGGYTNLQLEAHAGEVVRFFLTNTANTRIFQIAIPGPRMKLVAGDSGRVEHEKWIDSVLLAPSERAVVDVLFDAPGTYDIEHHTPDRTYTLGSIYVAPNDVTSRLLEDFNTLHANDELAVERDRLANEHQRPPDKTVVFTASMPLLYGDTLHAAETCVCPMHPDITSTAPAPWSWHATVNRPTTSSGGTRSSSTPVRRSTSSSS